MFGLAGFLAGFIKEYQDGNRQANQTIYGDPSQGTNSADQGATASPSSATANSSQGTGVMMCQFCGAIHQTALEALSCTTQQQLRQSQIGFLAPQIIRQLQIGFLNPQIGFLNPPPSPSFQVEQLDPQLLDLTAYRVWRIKDSYLISTATNKIWLPNQIMEGDVQAQMGVYAYKTLLDAIEHSSTGFAIGSVRLWGDTIEHENGYRASSARIIEIIAVLVGTPWSQERRDALAFFRAKYNHRENEE